METVNESMKTEMSADRRGSNHTLVKWTSQMGGVNIQKFPLMRKIIQLFLIKAISPYKKDLKKKIHDSHSFVGDSQ